MSSTAPKPFVSIGTATTVLLSWVEAEETTTCFEATISLALEIPGKSRLASEIERSFHETVGLARTVGAGFGAANDCSVMISRASKPFVSISAAATVLLSSVEEAAACFEATTSFALESAGISRIFASKIERSFHETLVLAWTVGAGSSGVTNGVEINDCSVMSSRASEPFVSIDTAATVLLSWIEEAAACFEATTSFALEIAGISRIFASKIERSFHETVGLAWTVGAGSGGVTNGVETKPSTADFATIVEEGMVTTGEVTADTAVVFGE
jgi:hypothetical protein